MSPHRGYSWETLCVCSSECQLSLDLDTTAWPLVVPARGGRMRRLPEQVSAPGELHRDPESRRRPRLTGAEDRGPRLHHRSLLPGRPAAGLPGAAGQVAGGRPAEGRPRREVRGVCVRSPDALGESPAGWALPFAGRAARTCATATAGVCLLCGTSGVGWIDSTVQRGVPLSARGTHLPPLRHRGQYAELTLFIFN